MDTDARELPPDRSLPIYVDLRTVDWSRVYRLPRVYDDNRPGHRDLTKLRAAGSPALDSGCGD